MSIITASKRLLARFTFGLAILILAIPDTPAAGTRIVLAQDQYAMVQVVVAQDASARVRQAAMNLADYLGRISDAVFEVITGDGTRGIAVGLPQNFPRLIVGRDLQPETIEQRERYLLRSHSDGVYVIGATETAVEDAVWDLLYRLGYRQFFPGPTWEVVPKIQTLETDVNTSERPDYLSRWIWYGFGVWDYNDEYYRQWSERNRARNEAFRVNTGHAYLSIINSYKSEFDAHPEYLWIQSSTIF